MTVAELEALEGTPPECGPNSQDFGYLVDPDGVLLEFNGNAETADLFSRGQVVDHVGLTTRTWTRSSRASRLPGCRSSKGRIRSASVGPCSSRISTDSHWS